MADQEKILNPDDVLLKKEIRSGQTGAFIFSGVFNVAELTDRTLRHVFTEVGDFTSLVSVSMLDLSFKIIDKTGEERTDVGSAGHILQREG